MDATLNKYFRGVSGQFAIVTVTSVESHRSEEPNWVVDQHSHCGLLEHCLAAMVAAPHQATAHASCSLAMLLWWLSALEG